MGMRVKLTGREWAILLLLAGVQFTNALDFMIVMPLGPEYTEQMKLSPGQFGWVASVYGYCAALSGLLATQFMDRFDRKRSLLFLYGGFTLATFSCALAVNYPLLLLARGAAGMFGGITAACVLAIVGDAFHDSRRGTAMGVVMSAFAVASIIGMPLGLGMGQLLGLWAPFVIIGGVAVGVLAAVACVLPPMRGHLIHASDAEQIGVFQLLTHSNFLRAYTLMATIVTSGFILVPFLPLYLVHNVQRPKSDLIWLYVCGGLATVVTMNIFGRLSDRFGKLLMFRILALGTLVPLLWFTNLPPTSLGVVLICSTLFWVLSSGRMVPGTALITASAEPRYRGKFLSINATVQHLGSALAATLGGLIIGQDDNKVLTNVPAAGLLAAAFMVLSVILAGQVRAVDVGPAVVPPDTAEAKEVAIVA
jgi:predicted MFS family arabinose efflux permease